MRAVAALFRPLGITFRLGSGTASWPWRDVPPLDEAAEMIARVREAVR